MNAQVETQASSFPSQEQEQPANFEFLRTKSTSYQNPFIDQPMYSSIFQIPTFPDERTAISSSANMDRQVQA